MNATEHCGSPWADDTRYTYWKPRAKLGPLVVKKYDSHSLNVMDRRVFIEGSSLLRKISMCSFPDGREADLGNILISIC